MPTTIRKPATRPVAATAIKETTISEPTNLPIADEARVDSVAEHVRLSYKGLRVQVTGIPSRRCVTDTQKAEAADAFGAAANSVSMSSLLWNSKEPAVQELRSVISAISRTFHSRDMTLPTVTPGLRMIRRACIGEIDKTLSRQQVLLQQKAESLKAQLPQIAAREKERRGRLFNSEDYNFDPTQQVRVTWHFPSVVEDHDLAELDDSVYQREVQRVRDEMRGVVLKAEEQMATELYDMLDAIVERLTGTDEARDGKPKKFMDNTVNKLFTELEFMADRMKTDGIGGKAMEAAANKLKATLGGHTSDTLPGALRKSEAFREQIRNKCTEIADELLKTAAPERRRRVLRQQS